MEKFSTNITRRDFIKQLAMGATAAAITLAEDKNIFAQDKSDRREGKMTYRTNKHGDKVSLLGYGCMRWPQLAKPAPDGNVVDQETVNKLVDFAIEHGVNYFDTAPVYMQGWSEKSTGIALKRHPREKFFIATKLSNTRNNWSREKSIAMYDNSFKNLQVDYIDYYLLHSVGGGDGLPFLRKRFIDNGMLNFLLNEREKGKIRNLGFSYHGDIAVFDYLLSKNDLYKWDFVQIQMNYVDWRHAKQINDMNTNAEYLYNELAALNIPVIIMEPLLGGRLAKLDKHSTGQLLAKTPDNSVASWAFRFAGSFPNVLTVLSGMTYKQHLEDNIKTFSPLKELNNEEFELLEEIADIFASFPTIPCTYCEYCMPCPYGINIPAVFDHYNKCLNEGHVISNEKNKKYAEARRAFLIGYDRSVPKLRQANHCIGCGKCKRHCPQNINIPQKMRKIDEFVEKLKQSRTNF